jgi:CHAP domain
MIKIIDVALRIADALTFVREQGYNAGQGVVDFLRYVGLEPGQPWCASFVSYVLEKTLPGQKTLKSGGCAIFGEWAAAQGCLKTVPLAGDVFLIYHESLGRFGHTGFVLSVNADGSYVTIEGNAADPKKPASRDGNGVYRGRVRTAGPKDRFIRWSETVAIAA